MDNERSYRGAGINPTDWRNLSLNDLTEINRSANLRMQKVLDSNQLSEQDRKIFTFHALQMHWVDPLCPAIPDGR